MTDKEKLDKLVAEIKRQKKEVSNRIIELGNTESCRLGLFDLKKSYEELLAFFDSMQKEPISEEFEKALAEEWQGYVDRGAATVDALEDNTQELAFAKGFYRGANWQKEQIARRLCNHANIDQMVEKFEDKYKPEKVLDTEYYKRGIFDTIKAIKEG